MTDDVHKSAPIYLFLDGEMTLEAPVKKVWPYVVNYPSWQNYSTVQHLSGTPGEEGQVVLLKKTEAGIELGPYFARTIKLEPGRKVVWKTYEDSEERGGFGIVEFRVSDMSGRTRFSYHTLYEMRIEYREEADRETLHVQYYRDFEAVFAAVFAKLKKLVEDEGP